MNLPAWILNLTHPPTWAQRWGVRLDCESWPTIVPVQLPKKLPHVTFLEAYGKPTTLTIPMEHRGIRKDVIVQLPLAFMDGDEETTPEVCCYPCDGNCLEVFSKLPMPVKCSRPQDMTEVVGNHFQTRR